MILLLLTQLWAARALPPDRPILSHCTALLMARSIEGSANQEEGRRVLREFLVRGSYLEAEAGRHLPYHGDLGQDEVATVRLGVDGENLSWPDAKTFRKLNVSIARLRQLELDLDRPQTVVSVLTEVRGRDAIEAFARRHAAVVRGLDADIHTERRVRLTAPIDHNPPAWMGLGFLGGGGFVYATDAMAPSSDIATAALGAIGAVFLLRPVERIARQRLENLPVRSARRDDVDALSRGIQRELTSPVLDDLWAHVGFSAMVSEDLETELRRVNHINNVSAQVLLDAERATKPRRVGVERRARLDIDQIFTHDDKDGQPVLINVARLHRPHRRPTTRSRPPQRKAIPQVGFAGAY